MVGKLYTYPNNFKASKIEIAAKYSGYRLELADFIAGETNKSDEFLKKFPLGKVPAFEEDDFYLFETNAIAYYIGNTVTRGGDNEPEVLQWIGIADNDILPAACTWVYPTLGIMQYNKQATEKAKEDVKGVLTLLNNHLLMKTYLVGERVTQADISVACTLLMLFVNVLEPGFRAPYPNVNRWFTTLVNQPEFKSVLGDVKLCEKMAQFDAKKYNEISGKGAKKETKKKEEKKANKPKKPDAGDQPTQAATPKPPKPDPWASCPKPSIDMDAWKKCFSNNPPDVAWKYFLEHFKKEDYSIWSAKYKYCDEISVTFMASNLVKGMTQRLEKMEKQSFGCTLVMEDGPHPDIQGVWFWLGQGLVFDLSDNWQTDYESYDWQKLDIDNEDDKKKIKEFWRVGRDDDDTDYTYNGKDVASVHVFK